MTTRGKKKATKTQHNEKMSILGYLKQMLNRINIGLIVAILSLIAAIVVPIIIYQWQKKDNDSNNSIKSEIELLKDSIAMNIAEIENTFHPEQIPIDIENDTIELKGKFTAIRDYQTHVLDFITNYGVIEASPSLTEVYKNTYKDEDEVRRIHDNITTNVRRFFISYGNIGLLWNCI